MERIKRYLKRILSIIKKVLEYLYYDGLKYRMLFKYNNCYSIISTKEIFQNEILDNGDFNRYDIIVRFLAIEEYYQKNDIGYYLYNKMQKKRIKNKEIPYLEIFKQTIESFEKNGYDVEYPIELSKDLKLQDGSHRISLIVYHNIPKVSFKIDTIFNSNIDYGIDWFKKNDFSAREIKIIKDKYDELKIKYYENFTGIIWGPAFEYYTKILEDIKSLEPTLEIFEEQVMKFENEYEYRSFLNGIYHIDDIEKWKIDKKFHYTKTKLNICIFKFRLLHPDYRKKLKTGKPISKKIELIKKEIRNKYKDKIKNYFYDIILHISDNEEQSHYMNELSEKDLKINEFLDSIKEDEYVIIKEEVPYMPQNFPNSYPLNKDLDILCSVKDYEKIVKKAILFSNFYKTKYNIKIIQEEARCKIRFLLNNYLCYQLDISNCKIVDIKNLNLLENKIKKKNYYIPSIEDEILIRQKEYEKNKNKKYHLEYVERNKNIRLKN